MPSVSKAIEEALSGTRLHGSVGKLSAVDRAMEEAIGVNRLGDSLSLAEKIGRQSSPIRDSISERFAEGRLSQEGLLGRMTDTQAQEMQKVVRGTLNSSLDQYHKSQENMRYVFGTKSVSDEVSKLFNEATAASSIDRFERPWHHNSAFEDWPQLPAIASNPIHETNEHLADVSEKIDALVDLQAKQAEVIDKLLQAQLANEAVQDRNNMRAYRLNVTNTILAATLSLIAIVVTIVVAG